MRFSAAFITLFLASTAFALPHHEKPTKQSNSATQVQKISVDQQSGSVWLEFDGGKVSLGNINTGNFASVSGTQSLDQTIHARTHEKPTKQSNKATQKQSISVDQTSGDVWLDFGGGKVCIGNINTGNAAQVDGTQTLDQSIHARTFAKPSKQSNKSHQEQRISVDQWSGDVYLEFNGGKTKLGNINTGNSATVTGDQSLDQSIHARTHREKPVKQSNSATQVQKISVNQESGSVDLYVDGGKVHLGNINTGNSASVNGWQSLDQTLDARTFREKPTKQSNSAKQKQAISVDQSSGDVSLWIDGHGYTSIGNINTGNVAWVSGDQSLDQTVKGRGWFDKKPTKQSNKSDSVQKIKVSQESGDVSLWVDGHGYTSIGNINTGNKAVVSGTQSVDQSVDA